MTEITAKELEEQLLIEIKDNFTEEDIAYIEYAIEKAKEYVKIKNELLQSYPISWDIKTKDSFLEFSVGTCNQERNIESFYDYEETKTILSSEFLPFIKEVEGNLLVALQRNLYGIITDDMYNTAWNNARLLTEFDAVGETIGKKAFLESMINFGLISYGEYDDIYVINKKGKEFVRKRDRNGQ